MSKIFRRAFLAMTMAAVASMTPAVYGQEGGVPEGAEASAASISISNCLASRHDFINNDVTGLATTSTAYVAVPGMTKGITTLASGCVIVTVSAYAFASGAFELQFVRVTLDGVAGNPIEVQFNGDDDEDADGAWARTHAAVFAFKGVPAGAHVVEMQHLSFFGGSVFLHRPAMEIKHR